ncbi:MAG: HlyD family type I secretion periplasmic adaptor subunit [Alphaproteobacteria bacterium]
MFGFARRKRGTEGEGATTRMALEGRGLSAVMTPARYADFLPDAQAIAAREHSPLARILLVAITLLAALAIGWAAFAEVEKVTTAQGRVRPDSRVKIINHPEGGRIQEIYVVEGQRVVAGAPLVEFDPEFLDEEVGRLREEWTTFAAQTARLEAESVRSNVLIFPEDLDAAAPSILSNQRALFDARRAAFAANRSAAEDAARRFEREVESLRGQLVSLSQTAEIRREQESRTRDSTEQGYFPRLRYLTIKNELVEAESQLASRQKELAAREAQLAEARGRVNQIEEDYFSDVLAQLVESRQQRDSLARELAQTSSQQSRLIVRAPVDGIVQNLTVSSSGQSVSDNDPLMNLIPTGDTLIIETRVENDDIGFIKLGQEAKIRVNTYDFVKFGTLNGTVSQIAADATEDPGGQGEVFNYVVLVKTDRTHLGPTPADQPVVPGMQVTADFKIGERTILSFLTDRVAQTTSTALRER